MHYHIKNTTWHRTALARTAVKMEGKEHKATEKPAVERKVKLIQLIRARKQEERRYTDSESKAREGKLNGSQ